MEIKTFGNCSKGDLCNICNKNITSESNIDKNPILNIKAKEFVPKKKINNTNPSINLTNNTTNTNTNSEVENKLLKLNLNASEYVPSNSINSQIQMIPQNSYNEQNLYENSKEANDDEDFEEPNDDELDMIMKDMMENDEVECDEESDDEKWFPKYKDCECCKGFVYKCKGNACQYLGACYCKVKNECDDS
jgi:hypothetical protein